MGICTFLALAWATGLNCQPNRDSGVERKAVAIVKVDSDTIPKGLEEIQKIQVSGILQNMHKAT